MTVPDTQGQVPVQDNKELNFRKQQQMYERMIAEKDARIEEMKQAAQRPSHVEDDDDEPYVDKKKLGKELSKFSEQNKKQTASEIQAAVAQALEIERQERWVESNPDFEKVMSFAEKFAEKSPGLAKSILRMPEGFERQKLVYENIKALGLDQPIQPQSTIQDKVNANRRSPFYQPSNVGSAPYGQNQGAGGKDYSQGEMKSAYDRIQALKQGLRLN